MRKFGTLTSALGALASTSLALLPASADPILIPSQTSIVLTTPPTEIVIGFSVNPSGTPVGGLQLNLSALASGLTIVSVSAATGFESSGPALASGLWIASFGSTFSGNQTGTFMVGTVTVAGLTAGTPLKAMGTFLHSAFNPIPFGPTDVATVVPEPTSAALLSLGILVLTCLRREDG